MGSGKSYWGRQWAAINHLSFVDLDELIEKEAHTSIAQIFEEKGEDHFRSREAFLLREQLANDNCIIACGGGTPCFHDNMHWMNEHGLTIFLSSSPQFILKNVKGEKEKRPMIKNPDEEGILSFIRQKLKERAFFYNKAQLTLEAENLLPESLSSVLSLPYQ